MWTQAHQKYNYKHKIQFIERSTHVYEQEVDKIPETSYWGMRPMQKSSSQTYILACLSHSFIFSVQNLSFHQVKR